MQCRQRTEHTEHTEHTEGNDQRRTDWHPSPFGDTRHDRESQNSTCDAPQQDWLVVGTEGVDRELPDRSRRPIDEKGPDGIDKEGRTS